MNIQTDVLVTHPVDQVYQTLRDRLMELVPFLPSVESIETVERTEPSPGKFHLVNHWQGKTDVAPKALRPFITKNMARWKDIVDWDDQQQVNAWRLETFQFDKLFECSGSNRFVAEGQNCRFFIQGNLEVFPERVPGVPSFLSRKLKPTVEKFIVDLVTPNLVNLGQGIQRFLDSHKG
jgi:hypothetical protein